MSLHRNGSVGPGGAANGWGRRAFRCAEEIPFLLDQVVSELDAAGYSRKETFGVRLALEEAMANAIKHGNRGDPSKEALLRWRVTAACVQAEVQDQGAGFDPEAVPDPLAPENLERPGGRGILLMRAYMNSVRWSARGTCVTLCRHRDS
jgi:serine/threonine-protein kinase RsbW